MFEQVQAVVVGIGKVCAVVRTASGKAALLPLSYYPVQGLKYGDVVEGLLTPSQKKTQKGGTRLIKLLLDRARIIGHVDNHHDWPPSQPVDDDEAWAQALQ